MATETQNWIITSAELKSCLDKVCLVDVREPQEVAVSYIPGSIHIPLGDLLRRAESELDKEADLVIYCAHGVRSMHGLRALKQLGFTKLKSLEGGIVVWEELYGPTRPTR